MIDALLRHRVLHLDTGIHLHEVEVAIGIDQELYRTHALVTDGLPGLNGGLAHALPQFVGHEGAGALFQ